MRRTACSQLALAALMCAACSQAHGPGDRDSGMVGSTDGGGAATDSGGLEGCFVMGTVPAECCPPEPEYYQPAGGLCRPGTAAASLCQGPCLVPGVCDAGNDCMVVPRQCCFCGETTLADVVAIREGDLSAYQAAVCGGEVACPPCVATPNPYLVATCAPSGCEALDLHATSAGCSSDSDCALRYANCCGCGGTEDEVIAFRAESLGEVEAYLCGGSACAADCVPAEITSHEARCIDDRCEAVPSGR